MKYVFGFIANATEVAIRTATLPLTVIADAATLGGVLNGRDESYTGKQLENILKKVSDIAGEIVD